MSEGVKFIRVRGRIVPIRGKDSTGKKIARKVDSVATGAGIAAIAGGPLIGKAAKHFGLKAGENLYKSGVLHKEGTRLIDASKSYKGAPSALGKFMSVDFELDGVDALKKSISLEKRGKFLGKVSSGLGALRRNNLKIGAGLLGLGLAAGIYGMRRKK